MAIVIRMPSVLAGATAAAIANWLVQPGDAVAVGTPLAEIETEKALVEYAAEAAGIVGRLVLRAGDSGEIGDPIAVLIAADESDPDIDAALGSHPTSSHPTGSPPTGSHPTGSHPTGSKAQKAPIEAGESANEPVRGSGTTGARVFASPLVRKLAAERGISLAGLTGTGPNGRIVRRDLARYLVAGVVRPPVPATADASGAAAGHGTVPDNPPALAAAGGTPSAGDTLIPHTPMRRAIARRLTESKASTPHFYLATECVVDELLTLRKRVNEASPVRVSVNDFVLMAVAAAFGDVPEANVTWSEEGLIAHRRVDLSIAVATEGGLVTPVLRGAERLRLSEIARQTADLALRARERRLRQHELEGGTFSVSNLGMYGTVEFSAIINPPQSGILAVGAARPQPVAVDGAVSVATVLRCTLSADHRAIDGAIAARWLAAFSARLENPLSAIV